MLAHQSPLLHQPIDSVSDPLFAAKQSTAFSPSHQISAEKPVTLPSDFSKTPGKPLPERTYVVTVGCFDVFHHGHAALLSHMQSLDADKLIVGIHDDQSIYTNKKLKVAQNLAERTAAVVAYAPDQIEVFEVKNADPTPELVDAYHRYEAQAQQERFHIRWIYMRGKDMPNFPGRSFVESVMAIEWHEYTKEVSSTFIRNEILPLAKSLVNFAREGCLNENMLQLLEKSAMIDHQLVMKYVMQTLNSEFMRSPSSPSLRMDSSPLSIPNSTPTLSPSDSDDSPPLSSSAKSSAYSTPSFSPMQSPDIVNVSLPSSTIPPLKTEGVSHHLPSAVSCCESGAHASTPLPPPARKISIESPKHCQAAGQMLGISDKPLTLFIKPVDVSSAPCPCTQPSHQLAPDSAEARAKSPSHLVKHPDAEAAPVPSTLPPLAGSDRPLTLPSSAASASGFRPRANSASPRESASTAVLLEIIAGLFSLYRDRTERLRALQTKLPQNERV